MATTYRVNITDRALADLTSIFEFIEKDSPQNAAGMVERILDAIDDLELMPNRFRRAGRSRKKGSAIHARVVQPFIVYYRIDEPNRMVFIVEVRHGARRSRGSSSDPTVDLLCKGGRGVVY